MLREAEAALPADIFIGVAAVADWRVAETAHTKIKKDQKQTPSLTLVENPDILAAIGQRSKDRRLWSSASRPKAKSSKKTHTPS